MRGSADFKLCNASGNTFSIFIMFYIYIVAMITLLSFLSRKGVACSSLRSVGVNKVLTKRFALGKIFKKRSSRGGSRSQYLGFFCFFSRNAFLSFCAQNACMCVFFHHIQR
jgi:hypothetical protein